MALLSSDNQTWLFSATFFFIPLERWTKPCRPVVGCSFRTAQSKSVEKLIKNNPF
jgi:hypothetical protein